MSIQVLRQALMSMIQICYPWYLRVFEERAVETVYPCLSPVIEKS